MRILILTLVLLAPLTAVAQETPAGEFAAGYQHTIAIGDYSTRQFPGWFVSGGGYVTDSLAIIGMATAGYTSVGIYDDLSKALFMTVWCPDSRSVESNCGIPRG